MKKLLTLVAGAALVLVVSVPTLAATDSITWGGSIQGEGEWLFRDEAPDVHGIQSEVYLWASADLADNVMAKVNLKYQGAYGTAASGPTNYFTGAYPASIGLYEGYVKLGKIFDSPVSLIVGRWVNQKPNDQGVTDAGNRSNLVPYYGEGFIIPNNGPVDGGKLTYDGGTWCVDLLWNKISQTIAINNDNTLYGAYGCYSGIENQKFDAYLLWDDAADAPATNSQLLIVGGRADGKITPVEGLGYKAELAWTETYLRDAASGGFNGFGGYGGVNYTFTNVQYTPSVRGNAYYLEHDFTQPAGHVDQYDLGESGYGQIIDQGSNLNSVTNGAVGGRGFYFLNLGATIKPLDKVAVDGDYYHYNDSWGNTVLGHEVDLRVSYQYTENVAAELIGGYYLAPGNKTGLTESTLLGLPGDAFLVKTGLKVTF